ncbi:ninja-family protein AFP1-like [Arachis ipaensis]|uniref:ninja-family protein AFP1-like n=1 Tax=Arachis ipaensis TaxID=130454 RepID=UPI0007AF63F5|nr:ninja-family protein AFP1-like [Arachis ipaensis]
MPMACTTNLMITCSLPMETEEEWRKRKELQTLRRLETRRKRSENQQRNMKAMRKKSNRFSSSFSEDIVAFVDGNNSNLVEAALNKFSSLERTTSLSTSVALTDTASASNISYSQDLRHLQIELALKFENAIEEEWRKRKELQTLRRLETRRKRSENQQRNMKAMRKKSNRFSSSFSEDIVAFVDGNNSNLVEAALNKFSSLERTTSLSTSVALTDTASASNISYSQDLRHLQIELALKFENAIGLLLI